MAIAVTSDKALISLIGVTLLLLGVKVLIHPSGDTLVWAGAAGALVGLGAVLVAFADVADKCRWGYPVTILGVVTGGIGADAFIVGVVRAVANSLTILF